MAEITNLKNKRVLVTGSTGFKGSWLCMWLNKLGAEVVGYALPPEHLNGNFNVCDVGGKIKQIYADVRSYEEVCKCVNDFKPEVVFHLAAQAIVLRSFDYPAETIGINTMGTMSVLEALRNCDSVKSIVVVTTDKCYKNDGEVLKPFTEDCHLGGDDPYSASKACAEIIARAYYKSFFSKKSVGLATVRAGNVVGGGDRVNDRIVPDCVKAIEGGKDIIVRNPTHVRPWQYVLEPLYGYLKIASLMLEDPKKYSDAWNFGPTESSFITVADFVGMILKRIESNTKIILGNGDGVKEKKLLAIDSTKAASLIGVSNRISIAEVARMVAEDYFSVEDPFKHCQKRISEYEELIWGNK